MKAICEKDLFVRLRVRYAGSRAKVQPSRHCILPPVSNSLRDQVDQTMKVTQRLLNEKQPAKTDEFRWILSTVKNYATNGTPAIIAGALLLYRAVRSARHGYLKAVAQAALGIAVLYNGIRQRRLDRSGMSFEEGLPDTGATDNRNRSDDTDRSVEETGDTSRRSNHGEESAPPTSSKNGDERELGGEISGEQTDPAFTADAETQGRSQPSLNADVHDPRRGREERDVDLSETAIPSDSTETAESGTEQGQSPQTNESGQDRDRADSQSDDEYEQSADTGSELTENGASEDDDNGEANTADSDVNQNNENGNGPGE